MSNADSVRIRELRPDLDSLRYIDNRQRARVMRAYSSSGPYISPSLLFPHLRGWLELLPPDSPKYSVFVGSIGLEAAVGAPHHKIRKALLRKTRRQLGDCSLGGVQIPSDQLIRKNRLRGVADLLATRSLTGQGYRTGLLGTLRHIHGALGNSFETKANPQLIKGLAGAVMEQTILCLLHDPAKGIIAVPSFHRQDDNECTVGGKKYRWDVTVESDGRVIPVGQYRLQIKSNASYNASNKDISAYHSDIIVISGSQHLGDNPYTEDYRQTTIALDEGNQAVITERQETLLAVMSNRGPATSDVHYLGQ